jgi:hypothetical protein
MQRFSTQSKLNLAHMTWEHIFQAISLSFPDSYLVHEISLRQKGTYVPPQVLTVYFGTPSMFITLWFGFDYGTNPPLGTLII